MDPGAQEIHGLTNEFLKQHPVFGDISAEFMNFLSDSTLIIHNAPFDLAFINMELIICTNMNYRYTLLLAYVTYELILHRLDVRKYTYIIMNR